jgi:cytochrome bd-type quinol oxidase subunit 2
VTAGLALLAVWALLAIYSVLMALDLGAGAYLAWARLRSDGVLATVVETYATPVWEAVNGLLVLLLLAMEAFFPRVINLYATVLLIPLGVTFALLSVRQVAFAMRHQGTPGGGERGRRLAVYAAGVVGLAVPLPAMTFFTVLQGQGFALVHGVPVFEPAALLFDPISLAFMALALLAELHLAAVFLRWFAELMGEEGPRRTFGVAAVRLAAPVAAAAVVAVLVLLHHVPHAAPALERALPLWLVALAALAVATIAIATGQRGPWPLLASAVMYLGGYMALGWSQLPYLVRGHVTATQAFTSGAMANAVGIVFLLGLLVVVVPCALLLTGYLIGGARARAREATATRS